jgi:hypothetical protein
MASLDENISILQLQLNELQQKVDVLSVRVNLLEHSSSRFTVASIVAILSFVLLCYFVYRYLRYRALKYEQLGP